MLETVIAAGMKVIFAIVVIVVGFKLIGTLKKFISKRQGFNKLDQGVQSFALSAVTVAGYVLVLISSAAMVGIPTTSFVTVLASAGVAVGLALQGSLSNVAGGLLILIFKPFKVGDYIENAGQAGTVTAINLLYTVVNTVDNKTISLPNSGLTGSTIINYSDQPLRRVDLVFSAAYSDDIEKVKKVIIDTAAENTKVVKDPAIFARVSGWGESAIQYTLRAWCKSADYWDVYFDLNEDVKKAFDANNITIPFKHIDVSVEQK